MKNGFGLLLVFLNCLHLSAQDLTNDKLQQQFEHYQVGALQEKLFVHTDKTFYLAGETIWFKIYALDANWHKPFTEGNIAYVEILNREGKPVIQAKILLTNGMGNGSLIIPGFLNSGTYVFRAYTSWMKNFPSEFYFEQRLEIINTLKTPAVIPAVNSIPQIQFFPEGGNHVFGLETKMAYKVTDGFGRGLDCSGVIVNEQRDTLLHFQSRYNGMGNFSYKPEKIHTYYAILQLKDTVIRQKLPDPVDQGIAMQVKGLEGDTILVKVMASSAFYHTTVYLFVQTRQLVKNVQSGMISPGGTTFRVSRKDLGDGISTLTLFNESRQPVCERLIFKRPERKLQVEIKTDQQVYETRRPVQVSLNTRNGDQMSKDGHFSMSVFLLDSLQSVPEQDIVSWLYLSSDLKGYIESPAYYFDHPDPSVDEALDNLLLTQGWRRFKWSDIQEGKKPYFEFLPEMEGPVVNAKVVNKLTGSPVAGSVAYLSIPGSDNAFSTATSDAQGNLRFGFRDIYKNNAVVVQPALLKDSNYRVDVTRSWSDKLPNSSFAGQMLSPGQENRILNRSIGNQVENTYGMDKKRRFVSDNPDSSSFYGIADKIYRLDDYTRFQTMEEVLREYVEDVRVRKEGGKFTFKIRNRLFGTYFEEDPLILLDGIPVGDATKIIALDPLKIQRIEVVTHNYFIGSSVFEGILNVKSYSGEMGVTQIDPNALVVEFEGLQQQRLFYSPEYPSQSSRESHLPDFRNLLFWAPQILTGPGGSSQLPFYSSDLKGRFAIVVEGISSNGLPGHAVSFFEVTDSK